MEREIARLLPYILDGTFVIGVLLFLLALQQLRRRRTGAHWRIRRKAGERGGRLFVISIGLMAVSVVLALISALVSLAHRNDSASVNLGPDDLYGIVLSPGAAVVTSEATMEKTGEVTPSMTPAIPDTATTVAGTATRTAAPASATTAPSATSTNTAVFVTNTPGELPDPTPTLKRLQADR